MAAFVNLTPHALHVYSRQDPDRPCWTIAATGVVARVPERVIDSSFPDHPSFIPGHDFGSCLRTLAGGFVEGLPPPRAGTFYVVSMVTALALRAAGDRRPDVLIPGPEIRDDEGRIIGCSGLARLDVV